MPRILPPAANPLQTEYPNPWTGSRFPTQRTHALHGSSARRAIAGPITFHAVPGGCGQWAITRTKTVDQPSQREDGNTGNAIQPPHFLHCGLGEIVASRIAAALL